MLAQVAGDELELRPLRGEAYSPVLAKKALAFKSISFSSLGLALSLRSILGSSSIRKGSPACVVAPSALLTQLATLLGSTLA